MTPSELSTTLEVAPVQKPVPPATESEAMVTALLKLEAWVAHSDWKAYDTFDGLSSPFAKFLTLSRPFLKQVWQQGVRRFPINLRPILRIKPSVSSKAMGFFAQGYLNLFRAHGKERYLARAKYCLGWLMANRSAGYKGYCWGNHFDYQSRGGNIPKGAPTIVWTGLIAHAFLDAYEVLGDGQYLDVARGACDMIVDELGWMEKDAGICLSYYPGATNDIHNSNMIGASLLSRVSAATQNTRYLEVAKKAVSFTVHHQTPEGAWYYGVAKKWRWVDSFHSGYVLEALHTYCLSTGDRRYLPALEKGYRYYVETFFGADGTPRYYAQKTRPLDIQCASQGIQTLVNLSALDQRSIPTALRVAAWTVRNMQDRSGYFYYRKYPLITNKTPTMHWGQATMFAALSLLLCRVREPAAVHRRGL